MSLSVTFGSIEKVVVLDPLGIKIVTRWPRRERMFASSMDIRVPPRLSSPMVGITMLRLILNVISLFCCYIEYSFQIEKYYQGYTMVRVYLLTTTVLLPETNRQAMGDRAQKLQLE